MIEEKYTERSEAMLSFTKMQGTGNDYVYMDTFEKTIKDPVQLAIRVSNRHFGIGSDGLILLNPDPNADFRMDIYNADGSQAEMCGNGIRCAAKYAYEKGLVEPNRTELTVATGAGMRKLSLHLKGKQVETVTVDMGTPIFDPEKIPVLAPKKEKMISVRERAQGQDFELFCVSMGNPHAVTFVDEVDHFDVEGFGKILERAEIFPHHSNIEFVQVLDANHLKMRVWERGSGETMSCGTGACATAVTAMVKGVAEREVTVHVRGGALNIRWDETSGHVYMTGPAVTVFTGWIEEA